MTTRAWSVLTVKSVDAEQRTIEGIATTPTVDRIGDIVEPLGGAVYDCHYRCCCITSTISRSAMSPPLSATKDGISIMAKFAKDR